jgi:high-affinity iron transporter
VLATFLIGLREGLEAALVVGILIAYVTRMGRRDILPRLWAGVGLAVALAVVIGAILTFGAYTLTFQAQELLGGILSLVTVAMVTWMIFWMQKTARTMKSSLEAGVDRALAAGGMWAVVVIGFISVAREGVEATLLLWSMVQSFGDAPAALLGALLGIAVAVLLGWLLARGMLRINLRVFFTVTGAFLVIVAAGVLAYAIHDLQEAGVVPGPFTDAAPLDPVTGAVAVGLAGFPFGWAFDATATMAPGGPLATILQSTVGFMPQMSWLQVIAWMLYVVIVGGFFIRGVRGSRPAAKRPAAQAADGEPAVAETATAQPELTAALTPLVSPQQGAA